MVDHPSLAPNPLKSQIGLLLGLMVGVGTVTAVVHWPVLSVQALSLDDQQFLVDNPLVQNPSWSSARQFLGEVLEPSTVRGYYLPLSMISLMLDHALGGRPSELRPFHRTSLVLHVVNTVLIIALLYSLFGQVIPAALVGLLFGVHPLTVEPIAWVGERKTLLAAFFTLWCLLCYVRHTRRGGFRWLIASLLMYILALMSKPTAAPLPVLLLVMDYWPLKRLGRRVIAEKWPFFAVGGVFAVITLISHGRTAGIMSPSEFGPARIPLMICHLVVFYLGKMVWPTNLTSVYPAPDPLSLSNPIVLAGLVGTAVLIAVLVLSLRRTRALLAGWLFFFVAIGPTLGVIQYSWVTASDKYLYVPVLGLLMVLAWGMSSLWKHGGRTATSSSIALTAAVVLLSVAEARGVRHYLPRWRDTLTHAHYMLDLAPNSAAAHNHLGQAQAAFGDLDEAIGHFREALKLEPGYPEAHYNLGVGLRLRGQIDEAIHHLRIAMPGNVNNPHAHYMLGLALKSKGQLDEAVAEFRKTLQLRPDYAFAQYSLAQTLQSQGKLDEAADRFRQAIEFRPDYAEAYRGLGSVLLIQGRPDEAIARLRRALEINPGNADAHSNLGSAFAGQGKLDEAIEHFRLAPAAVPADAEAHYNLAYALQLQGKPDQAIEHYRQAVENKPDYAEAQSGWGMVLTITGHPDQALVHFQEAVQLKPTWLPPLNAAAWILATHPDASIRRPEEAVRLAERAAALAGNRDAGVLDTLAAAYAASGRFDQAIATAQTAVNIATAAKKDTLAAEIGRHLELYRQGKPYIEKVPLTTSPAR